MAAVNTSVHRLPLGGAVVVETVTNLTSIKNPASVSRSILFLLSSVSTVLCVILY